MEDMNFEANAGIAQQAAEALLLLEYAIETGFKAVDGSVVPVDVVTAIKSMAARLEINLVVPQVEGRPFLFVFRLRLRTEQRLWFGWAGSATLKCSDWVEFEMAYMKLAMMLSPVTGQTLRDTAPLEGTLFFSKSPAQRFSSWLWLVAIGYALWVIGGEWAVQSFDPPVAGNLEPGNLVMVLISVLTPYAYGGLGACAYLLRSAHEFIYKRCFDIRRKPEYFNRILLGTISGGAIILLVQQVTNEGGETVHLGSAALGFVAGYSTDFLFNAVERIVSALLPKIDLNSMQKAGQAPRLSTPVSTANTDLKDLLASLEKATSEEDKKVIRALIDRVGARL